VSTSPRCHVLYALLIGSLVSAPGHAAPIALPGGQGAPAGDSNLKSDTAPGAANARPDPAAWREPLKSGNTVTRAAAPRTSAARQGLESPVLHNARSATLQRNFSPLRGATGNIAKPAIPAVRANLLRRSDPVHPDARAFGAASPGTAGRQSSPSFGAASRPVASRPVASLKALASNGVIGGPHAAGPGMVGGPATGKRVFNASIDGTALRRRF